MIIYLLTNIANGKVYVGQTVGTLDARWNQHLRQAKKGDFAIHRAIRKYGAESFTREVLAQACDLLELNLLERLYVSRLASFGPSGYNQTIGGDGVMNCRRHSDATRRKISEIQIGRKQTPEQIAKRVAHHIGKPLSEAHRRKVSESQRGRVFSLEHKERLSVSHRGKTPSPETIAKMSAASRGVKKTPEHCARISAGHRKRAIQIKQQREAAHII